MSVDGLAHVVYRCYDASANLLYIGCTHDINQRMDVHRASWGNPVSAALNLRMARYTEVEYPDKASGRRAEREAIYNEAPLLNLHHQKAKLAPASRRLLIDEYLRITQLEPDPVVMEAWTRITESFASANQAEAAS